MEKLIVTFLEEKLTESLSPKMIHPCDGKIDRYPNMNSLFNGDRLINRCG